MHPLFNDLRLLPWYGATWLLLGTLLAVLLAAAGLASWDGATLFALPLCLLFGFIAPSAYYLCRALPSARRSLQNTLTAFGSAALLCAGLWLLAAEIWNSISRDGLIQLTPATRAALFAAGFALYLLSLLAHDVVIAYEKAREAERREAQEGLLAREAELTLLRLQINPHFLFNSLNSISALTSFDAAGARAMAIELADFYRRTLTMAGKERIALADELALCREFLAIEQRRFGEKLAYRIDADDNARLACLPPMLLQPLVENAVKHGIYGLEGPGEIRITAEIRDGRLLLSIANPFNPAAARRTGEGVGLKNVQERLVAIYGPQAYLNQQRGDGDFMISLNLPQETTPCSRL